MTGVLIVTVVACLLFCVGLGFGILTLQREIEALIKEVETLMTVEDIEPQEGCIEPCHEHDDEFEEKLNSIEKQLDDLKQEFSGVKRSVYGTADVTEFARLKTAVYETLSHRIERLEDFINGKPEVIRIEDADKLEELRQALRVSAFEVKEQTAETEENKNNAEKE